MPDDKEATPGAQALEVLWEDGRLVYYVNGKEVSRQVWLTEGLAPLMAQELPQEVDRLERKAFGNIKNYLHNTLGITKEQVERLVQEILSKELPKILRQQLGITEILDQHGKVTGYSNVYDTLVRKVVMEQLGAAIKRGSFHDYVEAQVRQMIQQHIIARMKVDIRVQTINPEEGILREVISPDREAREV